VHFQAENGQHGRGKDQHGRNGRDIFIPVPPGTLARDAETDALIADLVEPNARAVVARGGRGGRGNSAFASSTHQAPRFAEKGEPGEARTISLELKLVADVGIIGLPNAGKSTFLASVTAARPKIADYPFTTLTPNLGVAEVDNRALVLADIPGLIEGAHLGAGLGDKFLRHTERTRVLLHLVDGSLPEPLRAFDTINAELAQYDPRLAAKPQIVAFNKMDLPDAREAWLRARAEFERRGIEPRAISAATGEGVRDILRAVQARLDQVPRVEPKVEEELPVFRPPEDENAFEISREGHAFRVRGRKVERVIAMTNWDQEEGIARAHRVLRALGVTDALTAAGVREGDTVRIGEVELEWKE
jgi:GTP-binding protein